MSTTCGEPHGSPKQPNGFEQLLSDMGIVQKNGAAHHPTTQGKVERYHQTLKRWLIADGLVDTVEALNTQLVRFAHIYNTQRPHRAIGRRTPETAYTAITKAIPVIAMADTIWRVRYDQVDATGTISIRYAGKLRHLGIGRAWARKRVLLLMQGHETMVIDRVAGEIIAEHTLDASKDYQKKR
ncbi:Integrase core domain-containing protein [Brevibacterium sp. 239c]|uniref:integrase core domain-containing protein n=1 Tax=Brevibacterium sp. 239c TaxID=1965356 RepID=UPI000C613E8E|nr:integrase core domain-containing protein [Brevibacterium sp. 239c]SMY05142.1 Integrase core domain-containing protein [Brevibacterium sp. 239c]